MVTTIRGRADGDSRKRNGRAPANGGAEPLISAYWRGSMQTLSALHSSSAAMASKKLAAPVEHA